ncbi:MAG TPA: hypothetical protein VKB50_06080 [Vicinamibacterales bacterium]|nr:hypothetical protein [Vicinamibacterales bacterium]
MTKRRPIALAAALCVTIGLGSASAQTVVVRNAPPNSTIEFVLNGSATATAKAGADGVATLTATKGALADRDMIDVVVWVDDCGSTRRVLVMSRAAGPPPTDSCRRSQVQGLFLLQRVTSILVDVEAVSPTVRLRQGPLPEEWLKPPKPEAAKEPRISIAPRGAILFGGGQTASMGGVLKPACGDVTTCTATDRAFSFSGGFSYWFSQYVAAEASYMRMNPSVVDATGSGDHFRFDSDVDGGLIAVVAKGGLPIGRFRLFGSLGADYHRATFTTHETVDQTTAPGGITTLQWRTKGWGPVFGGGTEVWITRAIGIYGEFTRVGLNGTEDGAGEAKTDTMINALVIGGRYRLGRR